MAQQTEYQQTIDSLNLKVAELSQALLTKNSEMIALANEIVEGRETIATQAAKIVELESKVTELTSKIAESKAVIQTVRDAVNPPSHWWVNGW
jgi:chromosome segregation ATPase